ncbi:MAG: hypothetical protein RDU89_09145 [bacterium]|nr:hypothetical protein [bacterium]
MEGTVVGVFKSEGQAEKAVGELKDRGFRTDDVSLIAREGRQEGGRGGEGGAGGREGGIRMGRQDVGEGVATGGVLGGAAGLLAGAGALAIPGIGPVLAAGPIAAALSGAVTGGIAGGLVDYGIPAERGRQYEDEVKRGNIVAVVRCKRDKTEEAAQIFRRNGAVEVETH